MTRAERIRRIMAGGEAMTAMELADLMKVRDYDGLARIRTTLQDLQARGVVERVEQEPRYKLVTAAVRGTVQDRIWKALIIRGAKGATVQEAAVLAAACLDYAKRYLRWLARRGYAKALAGAGQAAKVYQVAAGREILAAPAWCRRHEDRRRRQEAA